MGFRPGRAIQLEGSARAWLVRSLSIEGMAVAIEAEAAPVEVPVLPAAPGRATREPDIRIGRTELALFELPALGEAPEPFAKIQVAACNAGLWKQIPVSLLLGTAPAGTAAMVKPAVLGIAETVLDPRAPMVLDAISTVVVTLANPSHVLLNADDDALMAGANLAMLGDELLQFGSADQIGEASYRLLKLLRGRRGTEWAAFAHAAGESFCMVDAGAMRSTDFPPSAVAGTLTATAHGIGDQAPLPTATRIVLGESQRPPSPCHLTLRRDGANLIAGWTRRTHRGWAWLDGIGVADDGFPELYQLTISGPAGSARSEMPTATASFPLSELPAAPGEEILLTVSSVGPAALSRPATATITL
jgi:hypothetical protein